MEKSLLLNYWEVTIVEGKLADLIARNKKATLQDSDDEMEEDDMILQYCSDNGNMEVDDMDSGDSDDDWVVMVISFLLSSGDIYFFLADSK